MPPFSAPTSLSGSPLIRNRRRTPMRATAKSLSVLCAPQARPRR